MTEYGQAFYGSDEIHQFLGRQLGEWRSKESKSWLEHNKVTFSHHEILYKLPIGHWFYGSDQFKNAKKPSDEIVIGDVIGGEGFVLYGSDWVCKKPNEPALLLDYSEDELQNKIKSMQAEIERRKSQDDEITILARQICADNNNPYHLQADFIEGRRDKTIDMRLAKAGVIAGMELQKGRET